MRMSSFVYFSGFSFLSNINYGSDGIVPMSEYILVQHGYISHTSSSTLLNTILLRYFNVVY